VINREKDVSCPQFELFDRLPAATMSGSPGDDDTGARIRDDGCMAPPSPPTLDELRRLAATLQGITAAHGALGLQVFGSVVHGSARPGSDLDLLVEFPASPSFEQFMDLKLALEDLLSVPVDLVTRRGLRAELRQRIEDEAIPLA
jgi:predicted nucleotidyltransferase